MSTPFDAVIDEIARRGFHNHRLQEHSDLVSKGIFDDLVANCPPLKEDVESGRVTYWLNVRTPGARQRKIDLLIGEPTAKGKPDLEKLRICLENKSVVTAHRNRDARFDDLNEALQVLHKVKPDAVLVATVIVGVAERVLNVPDRIKPFQRNFDKRVLPRLSKGDPKLWDDFKSAISWNKPDDPKKTVAKFRQLPTRPPGHTHVAGYDYVLVVPAHIDNVNRPRIPRPNDLGIDLDADYKTMLSQICKAYRTRWHL
jgi:hypothetical protein